MRAVVLTRIFPAIRVPGPVRMPPGKARDPLSVFSVNLLGGQHAEPGRGSCPPEFTLSIWGRQALGRLRGRGYAGTEGTAAVPQGGPPSSVYSGAPGTASLASLCRGQRPLGVWRPLLKSGYN